MNRVVILSRRASRDVRRLDTLTRRRVFAALDRLLSGVATDVVRLAGIPDTFRLRVGDWRVIFEYRQSSQQILVKKIGHRREVYR